MTYYVLPLMRWLPLFHPRMLTSALSTVVLRRLIMPANSTPRNRRILVWYLGMIYTRLVRNPRHSVCPGLGNTLLRQRVGYDLVRPYTLVQVRSKVNQRWLTPLQHTLSRNMAGRSFSSSLRKVIRKHTNLLRVS